MMMQGLKLRHDVPFRDIYIHGLVRDASGQKMSKTKGNVIDPLDLIAQHGADATRFTLMTMCGHGQDIRMSVDAVRGARLFANKLWNASRFAAMNRCFEAEAASALPAPQGEIAAWVVNGLADVARATTLALDGVPLQRCFARPAGLCARHVLRLVHRVRQDRHERRRPGRRDRDAGRRRLVLAVDLPSCSIPSCPSSPRSSGMVSGAAAP